jgi:lysophospholipase L1-like esterase
MKSVLDVALNCVVGAVEIINDSTGAVFQRSPLTGRSLLGDLLFDLVSAMPSGVRIEMVTDAATIDLGVELSRVVLPGAPADPTVFDLVVDDRLREPVLVDRATLFVLDVATGGIDIQPAEPAIVRFELGEATAPRRVEIWLPAKAMVRLLDVRVPQGSTLRPAPTFGPSWVHHGSSISQCTEADRPTNTWPAIVARTAGLSLTNLGLAGQCHLDRFMVETIRDIPAAAITLELGINVLNGDTLRERTFVPALHAFLDTIRDGQPDTPITVITPIICPVAENHPGPTFLQSDGLLHTVDRPANLAVGALTLTRIRELLNQHVAARSKQDPNLHILNGPDLFGPKDLDALPDGLHPNTVGYRRMAERFLAWGFAGEFS